MWVGNSNVEMVIWWDGELQSMPNAQSKLMYMNSLTSEQFSTIIHRRECFTDEWIFHVPCLLFWLWWSLPNRKAFFFLLIFCLYATTSFDFQRLHYFMNLIYRIWLNWFPFTRFWIVCWWKIPEHWTVNSEQW